MISSKPLFSANVSAGRFGKCPRAVTQARTSGHAQLPTTLQNMYIRQFLGKISEFGQKIGDFLKRLLSANFSAGLFVDLESWTHKWKSAYSFLSLGSYLNMYHGYASLKKEHFLPVFIEKRALFQHILRDTKSTKCEIKEHLWERAIHDCTNISCSHPHLTCSGQNFHI